MLTTTLDGLWVLQVLSGIEVLAPELGLRPHLPSAEDAQLALSHPVAAELAAAGVITGGELDAPVLEWLTVLSRRDGALLLYAHSASGAGQPERVLLARFGPWWAALERSGDVVRLSEAGTATCEQSALALIGSHLNRLLGARGPATLRPVVLRADELLARVRCSDSLRGYLASHRLDADQVRALMAAADIERSDQFSIVALPTDAGAVTVVDTPVGRLLTESVCQDRAPWLIVSPGSAPNISAALHNMMRRLPTPSGRLLR